MSRSGLLRLVLLALMWGSSFLWIKIALNGLNAVQIALGRVALGAVFLFGLCLVVRLRLPASGRLWMHIAIVALMANALPFTLFGLGERTIDSGLAGVLNATTPLWTAVIALLTRQERRLGPVRAVGLVFGFAGTVLIVAPWQGAAGSLVGTLLCTVAAAGYGAGLVYASRFVVNRGIGPVPLAAAQIGSATGWMLLATPVFGLEPIRLDPTIVLAVVVLGLLGTGYAFVLVNRLVAEEGPTSTSTVTYLLPVVAVLLGAVVLDEQLGVRVLTGMVIVLVGVMLTQRKPRPRPAVPVADQPAVRTGG